ncbi:MAG: hypothetical protein ACKVT1_15000 [Dehalococcoidia bacterium]
MMTAANANLDRIVRFPRPEVAIAGVAVLAMVVLVAAKLGGADLSRGELIVIALRLAVPFLIFRNWLLGGIVAMLLDAADVIIVDLLKLGGFGAHYAELDKILDSYYYVIEVVVALRWDNPWMRWPAAALFVYRLIGAALFEVTDTRALLFVFPNLFENWWLYCVVVMKWFPAIAPHGWKSTITPLLLLLIPKMGQEYLLHVAEAKPWNWTKERLSL